MYTPYKNLPNNSRVWIYQSNREFTEKEIEFISTKAEEFINSWTRHGDDLKGSFTIKYNQFLVLAVDESFNNVSGCSIDASVHFIQALEKELQLNLMDKLNVTFKNGNHINLVRLSDFQKFAKEHKITPILFPEHPQKGDPAEAKQVYDLHLAISQKQPSCIAPVGFVWNRVLEIMPSINLHSADGNHTSYAGNVLTAMTFYQIITSELTDTMPFIPAIDLKDGQCVRLKQGVMEDSTVFSDDPVLTISSSSITDSGSSVTVILSGGTVNTSANVTVRITTDSTPTRTDDRTFRIRIKDL